VGLFSRWRSSSDLAARAAAVDAFWAWWRGEGALTMAAAIEADAPDRVIEEIGSRVEAIHPELEWELAPGRDAAHLLVVTAAGDPELRAVARRWRRAAPVPDPSWEYSDLRPAAVDPWALTVTLEPDGVPLAAADVLVSARVSGTEIDVGLFHPAFPDLSGDDARLRAAALLLVEILGEHALETWVGTVAALSMSPLDPIPLPTLPDVVRQLRDLHTDEDGAPVRGLLEGTDARGNPVVAIAQLPLKAATAPHLDTHVQVAVPYADQEENGLPGAGSHELLRRLEDHLTERMGDSGRIVASQSHGGVRVLHLYVDGATPAAEQVRAAVSGWEQGVVRIRVDHDPAWDGVSHLRG
jgi:hypothetical protein